VPAQIRKELSLKAGSCLVWERLSSKECRVLVKPEVEAEPDPMAALGFGPRTFKRPGRTTRDWMRELREGDE
jgi:hypothetical protein